MKSTPKLQFFDFPWLTSSHALHLTVVKTYPAGSRSLEYLVRYVSSTLSSVTPRVSVAVRNVLIADSFKIHRRAGT
jgi:hypothetical protein